MTRHDLPSTASPVHAGTFSDGPDSVLLNPDIPARRWRHEYLRAAVRPPVVLAGLAGAVLAVLAVLSGSGGIAAVITLATGLLAIGVSALIGWDRATGTITDHHHAPGRPCRLDEVRGEFFFRSRDFADLGAVSYVARTLIASVDELHRSPSRDWIDPTLPREAHRVVWHALCRLECTRDARTLAAELAAEPDTEIGALAAAAHEVVTAIDDGLDEVVRHLHACVVLTRTWEAKLRHADLAARTDHTLAALPDRDDIRRLADIAETLPQAVFAYVTAARDVTDAGSFPWEQPRSLRWRLSREWHRRTSNRAAAPGMASRLRVRPEGDLP